MFVEDTGFGSIQDSFRNFAKAASQPIKNLVKNPKSLLDPRNEWKTGIRMGKAAEKVAVSLNPLNPTLKKLGQSGIKAGKKGNVVAKVLGRTSEKARENPIATSAIVYGAALAIGKGLAAKGAASAAGKAGAAGATSAGAGGAGAGAGGLTAAEAAASGTSAIAAANKVIGLLPGKKGDEEIDPFAADAELAKEDQSGLQKAQEISNNLSMAGMFTGKNIMLFLILGGLTATGVTLFYKPKK